MGMYVYVCTPAHVEGRVEPKHLPQITSLLLRKGLSLISQDWLTSKLQGPLRPHIPALGLQACAATTDPFHECWKLSPIRMTERKGKLFSTETSSWRHFF